MKFTLRAGHLSYSDLKTLLNENTTIELHKDNHEKIFASEKIVADIIAENKTVYGINTGFGSLANKKISLADLELLQRSIVLSHAAGTGEELSNQTVRLILALKINSLARGYSGIRLSTLKALIDLYNHKIYPCIPCKGSVGASGDLAPLAHLSALLLGEGNASYEGKIISAKEALKILKQEPIIFGPKEGLALLNGTQASTALALLGLFETEKLLKTALVTGAMSVDALLGSLKPFDERIQTVRGHKGQIEIAKLLRQLLTQSELSKSHANCDKVQDPYSLRCQPQVMGACLTHFRFVKDILVTESNAVSDNPLVFSDEKEILSGGNFHAEPVAMAADTLALSIAEIGALSERRIALLIDPHFNSGLPPFLVENAGVNSGFMLAQVTSAALASENKSLAHPASVDSIPTSANQEDHVSMATFAGRRLLSMVDNTLGILAIELLAACQGIDFRRPLTTSPILETIHKRVRKDIPFYSKDRYFAPDIARAKEILQSDLLDEIVQWGF